MENLLIFFLRPIQNGLNILEAKTRFIRLSKDIRQNLKSASIYPIPSLKTIKVWLRRKQKKSTCPQVTRFLKRITVRNCNQKKNHC